MRTSTESTSCFSRSARPRRSASPSITSSLLALLTFASAGALVNCSSSSSSDPPPSCTGTQALTDLGIRGSSIAPKTFALTFDDGPGPRTKQLSSFLKAEGIQAAFFVNGRSMGPDAGEILQQLVADGHLVANHTETHQSLTGTATATPRPADTIILDEIAQTDAKIAPYVTTQRWLFRPPFGDYDATTHAALASTPMNKYVGPVLWDIGDRMDEAGGYAADWDCWQDGSDGKRLTMEACGDLYLTEMKRAGRGIVLMHDPYFNELDPNQAGTVDMVMYLVPLLKAEGFTFTRVDLVPDIAKLLPAETGPGGGSTIPNGNGGDAPPSPPNGGGNTGQDTSATTPCP